MPVLVVQCPLDRLFVGNHTYHWLAGYAYLWEPLCLWLCPPANYSSNGTLRLPFPVQPIEAPVSMLHVTKPPVNNSYDLDVGSVSESCNCSSFKTLALPCLLFQDRVLFGEITWPSPTYLKTGQFRFSNRKEKEGNPVYPFVSHPWHHGSRSLRNRWARLFPANLSTASRQLINDVDLLTSTIQVVQDQLDSLAEVVLQNRRGLDLLTAEKGPMPALNEQCCFYANRSGTSGQN
ncbi:envelope glycoprotein [Plecturocebus cupreus]